MNMTAEFWNWFSLHQEEIYQNVENPEFQETFFDELLTRLRQIDPHLGFEFSPIFEDGIRQMCISANGVKTAFPAVIALVNESPEWEHWQFIAFRQRKPYDESSTLKIDGYELTYDDLYFRYAPDQEGIRIQLNVRNYTELMHNGIFLLIDALVGEYEASTYITSVEFAPLDEEEIDELYNIRLLPDIVDAFAPQYQELSARTPEELHAWVEELGNKPLEEQDWDDWQELADATFGQDAPLFRRAVQAQIDLWHRDTQWALTSDDTDVATPPNTLLLALQSRLAFSYEEEEPEKTQSLLKQLLGDSQNLQAQYPDENWLIFWVNMSRNLAYTLPDEVETIVAQLQKAMPHPANAFDHRAIQILSERTRSYASYTQGNLQKAIEQGMAGFSCLHDSPYDMDAPNDGRLDLIQWLEEAGDTERQVQVMNTILYDIYDTPEEVRYDMTMKAWEMMQNGVQHPILALYIGGGAYEEFDDYLSYSDDYSYAVRELRDADPQQRDGFTWYRDYVELAKQWAKGNPEHEGIVAISEAMFLHRTTDEALQDDAHNRRVSDLLESGCKKAPSFVNPPTITLLWMYRLRVYGRKALTMPFVPAGNAAWSYNSGLRFLSDHAEMELNESFQDLDISGEEAVNLTMQYYADGIARYEHFWATGEGGWRDGWSHIYAMMCHNYSILLRCHANDYKTGLDVELKAVSISPFGEAYEGAASCYEELGDQENYIKTHEELWQFAQENYYEGYDFAFYLQLIVRALHSLDRNDEQYIWYERLQIWWASLDEERQEEQLDHYYAAISTVLGRWSEIAPEEALAELENYTDDLLHHLAVSETTNGNIFGYAAMVYNNNKQYQEAIKWIDRAIVVEDDEENREVFVGWWEEYAHALRNENGENSDDEPNNEPENKKPWWKRW